MWRWLLNHQGTKQFHSLNTMVYLFMTGLILLWKLKNYLVSLPGEYKSVEFEFINSTIMPLPKTTEIQSIWLQEVYKSFRNFHDESPIFCGSTYVTAPSYFDYCVVLKVSNQKSFLFFRKYYEPVNLIDKDNSLLKKWDKS